MKFTAHPDYPKRLYSAADHLGAASLRLIGQVLRKHNAAVIEASLEKIEEAVAAEREACALIAETAEPYCAADLIRKRGCAPQ